MRKAAGKPQQAGTTAPGRPAGDTGPAPSLPLTARRVDVATFPRWRLPSGQERQLASRILPNRDRKLGSNRAVNGACSACLVDLGTGAPTRRCRQNRADAVFRHWTTRGGRPALGR